jgi:hypothetical protein
MEMVSDADRPYVFATRIFLLAVFLALAVLVKLAWRRKRKASR